MDPVRKGVPPPPPERRKNKALGSTASIKFLILVGIASTLLTVRGSRLLCPSLLPDAPDRKSVV